MCRSNEGEGVLPWQNGFNHTMVKGSVLSVWSKDQRRIVWDSLSTAEQIDELEALTGRFRTADELREMVVDSHDVKCDGPAFALSSLYEALSERNYGGEFLHTDVVTTD